MSAKKVGGKTAVLEKKTIADLKTSYFVRRALDPDRVNFFVLLYQGNPDEVPPIKVETDTDEVVDGRHRKAALEVLQRKIIECEIVPRYENKVELLMDAYTENLGGALPPTYQDTVFVIRQLLESGLKGKEVGAMFAPYYPPSAIRRYLSDAYSAVMKARMLRAKNAVAQGQMKVDEAAEKFAVDVDALRQEITGARRKKRSGGVPEIKSASSTKATSYSQYINTTLRYLVDRYEDGEVTEEQVKNVLEHFEKLNARTAKTIANWRDRFVARKQSMRNKS